MNRIIFILLALTIFFLLDLYVFQGVKVAVRILPNATKQIVHIVYWGITLATFLAFLSLQLVEADAIGKNTRTFLMTGIFMNYFSKMFVIVFLVLDDVLRLGSWVWQKISPPKNTDLASASGQGITRSEFLARTGLVVASLPLGAMFYGIASGAHDYRIRRKTLYLPHLPNGFDGMKICQLSDIHSGSFFNKKAVGRGVDMVLGEKPDLVFFTGDLVNNRADEIEEYIDIFGRIEAPLGVYSTLGNHDYGDYVRWESMEAKKENLERLKQAHGRMGWRLLMNEHVLLEKDGEKIAVIGIENWSAKGRFPKHGRLDQAWQGTEEARVKLLLSHDPSHWEAQVVPEYSDIDITFSGHTHGAQFGVEIPGLKWSPVQYMYEQWAGLYQKNSQYLYVNRGFGYLGFPGRVGILPEITLLELRKGEPVV